MSFRDNQAIIARRGASFDAPENTLAAVLLAWKQGADAVEVDVHLSRDGRVVVLHDANIEKLFGLERQVEELDFSELQRLDAGRHKGARWAGKRIPALEEILETLPDGKRLFIEIKASQDILVPLGVVFKKRKTIPRQIVLIGFDLETMSAAKKRFTDYPVFLVSRLQKAKDELMNWKPTAEELVTAARGARSGWPRCGGR